MDAEKFLIESKLQERSRKAMVIAFQRRMEEAKQAVRPIIGSTEKRFLKALEKADWEGAKAEVNRLAPSDGLHLLGYCQSVRNDLLRLGVEGFMGLQALGFFQGKEPVSVMTDALRAGLDRLEHRLNDEELYEPETQTSARFKTGKRASEISMEELEKAPVADFLMAMREWAREESKPKGSDAAFWQALGNYEARWPWKDWFEGETKKLSDCVGELCARKESVEIGSAMMNEPAPEKAKAPRV